MAPASQHEVTAEAIYHLRFQVNKDDVFDDLGRSFSRQEQKRSESGLLMIFGKQMRRLLVTWRRLGYRNVRIDRTNIRLFQPVAEPDIGETDFADRNVGSSGW